MGGLVVSTKAQSTSMEYTELKYVDLSKEGCDTQVPYVTQ